MKYPTSRATFIALVSLCFTAAASAQANPDQPPSGQFPGEPGMDSPGSNPTALTDGTPISTTTMVASDVADSNAFLAPDDALVDFPAPAPAATSTTPAEQISPSMLGVEGGVGRYEIDGVKADLWTLTVPYSVRVNKRSTIVTTMPFTTTNFRDTLRANGTVGDAKAYGMGVNAGWRYRVVDKQDNVHYRWNITPSGGVYLRRSSDLRMGSWVNNLSLSSSFAYQFSGGWVVNLGNSLTMAWNNGYRGYPDPVRDSQQVVMTGLQILKPIDRWTIAAKIVDTRYLRTNLVGNFQIFALSAGYRITPTRSLHVSLVAENGKGYHSFRGTAGANWRF